jgi:hypothetical protein
MALQGYITPAKKYEGHDKRDIHPFDRVGAKLVKETHATLKQQ